MAIVEIVSSNTHLLEEFIKHDFSPTFRYFQHKTVENIVKNHHKTILYVKDNLPIGYAHIDYDVMHDMYWVGCCVVSHHRNQGIGTKLFEKIIDYFNKSTISTLYLSVDIDNIPAIKLYSKYGFTIIRSTDKLHIMNLIKHNIITIPVSFGEAIDKLTILDIKLDKIKDDRRTDVEKEYNALYSHLSSILDKIRIYYNLLKQINLHIWNDQDIFRYSSNEEEKTILCKKIIEDNDARYRIKHKINHILSSAFKEQKGYEPKVYSIYYKNIEDQRYVERVILYQSIFHDKVHVYCSAEDEETLRRAFIHDPSIVVLSQPAIDVPTSYVHTYDHDIKNKLFFEYIDMIVDMTHNINS
jgi:GNAT superfamily N-acetyltransferase